MHISARSIIATSSLALLAVLPACGGGSGGAGGSEKEFCDKLRELESMPETDDPAVAFRQLADLADKAPNNEIRSAMAALEPLIEKIGSIDPNSEDAFGEIFALMFDPDVIKAGEVLDSYSKDVCGIEPDDGFIDTGGDYDAEDGADGGSSSGTVFDDLEAGDIGDAVSDELSMSSPDTVYSGASMSSGADSTIIQLDLTGERGYDADQICGFVLDFVAENSTDTAIEVVINHDGSAVATCTP